MSKEMTIDDLQELLAQVRAQHGNLVVGVVDEVISGCADGVIETDYFRTFETVQAVYRDEQNVLHSTAICSTMTKVAILGAD